MIRFPARFGPVLVVLAVVGIAIVLFKVMGDRRGESQIPFTSLEATPQEALMQQGLDLLYRTADPVAAAETFREVLTRSPTHYGAHFQLATALDRAGRPTEARPIWEEVLRLAEVYADEETATTAQARLAQPDTLTTQAMMSMGLDLLYRRGDPTEAADQFRQVLERDPTHYGAHYQLAVALDRAGRPAEARPWWEKTLELAEAYNDQQTAATARARLQRRQ